eukprot:GEMP01029711.1.p1 GENE.GEMP01029711.1~~GEMP01029711.1.p1  ORF type:complete len:423 (+),score=70.93 GEMP01029711.1:67-1335(+)
MKMLLLMLMLSSVAAQWVPTSVAPEYFGSQQPIESNSCDVAPRGGGAWNFGRVEGEKFATYEWPTEKSGCYLVEVFHPSTCKDITLSIAVPVRLTYYGNRKWKAYFDQTENGSRWRTMGRFIFYGGHPGVLTIGGHSPEYVDTDVSTLNWIAPELRVTWWNTGCGMPRETERPRSQAQVPDSEEVAVDDEDLVPEPLLYGRQTKHEIEPEINGCYLLEAQFLHPYTIIQVEHEESEALTMSSVLPGDWEVLTVRYFHVGDEISVDTSDDSKIRFTFVGHECQVMRDVTVRMAGNFSDAQMEHVSKSVVRNIAEERKVEAWSIIKRRVWNGSINIEVYTFGIDNYEATTLCSLVDGTPCEAEITSSEVIYNHLIFRKLSNSHSITIAMYVLIGVASVALICAIFMLCNHHFIKPRRRKAGQQQ